MTPPTPPRSVSLAWWLRPEQRRRCVSSSGRPKAAAQAATRRLKLWRLCAPARRTRLPRLQPALRARLLLQLLPRRRSSCRRREVLGQARGHRAINSSLLLLTIPSAWHLPAAGWLPPWWACSPVTRGYRSRSSQRGRCGRVRPCWVVTPHHWQRSGLRLQTAALRVGHGLLLQRQAAPVGAVGRRVV